MLDATPITLISDLFKATFLVISALFPIVNPIGGSPIFLSLSSDYDRAERYVLSRQIAIYSFFLLVGSYLTGTHVLAFFGISLPVVQVGGGLVVISTGWSMLQRGGDNKHENTHRNVPREDRSGEAFYPLTLPLTVGPGSISVAITLGANAPLHYPSNLATIIGALIGSALIAVSIYLSYSSAERLARIVGATGMSVILRLSSFLLVCIGVQILWNGLRALFVSLPASAR
jgi:multiple antibiotic resistance protein